MPKSTLLAITFLALCRAQAPVAAPSRSSVAGQVVSVAGEPLKKVTLRQQQLPTAPGGGAVGVGGGLGGTAGIQRPAMFTTQSDAEGKFVFEDLDPGRYSLSAERPGYVRQTYSGSAAGGGNLFTLASGQSMTGLSLKMTPEAVISGRVTDVDGDPFPKVSVRAYRVQYTARGRQVLATGSAETGLDGTFTVDSLTAGRYYSSAQDRQSGMIGSRASSNAGGKPKAPEEAYAATFYPSTLEMPAATSINLAAGAQVRGMDIRMMKTPVFHIRGKVVDLTTGTAPANAMLRVFLKDSPQMLLPLAPVQVRNGEFETGPLPPGDYVLEATPYTTRSAAGVTTNVTSVGRQIVTVGNRDVEEVTFRIGPGPEITGKITTEPGAANQPASNLRPRVFLNAVNGPGVSGESQDDGSFTVHGLAPALYQINVTPLPMGTYVKSIRFGSQDVTRSALDLTSGAGGTLNVLLSANAADVSGVVRDSGGTLLPGVQVTLWTPGAQAQGLLDLPKTALTDANGGFKFSGIGPGEYRVAAWEQVDLNMAMAAEFRGKFESKAAAVKLSENSHESVEAPLIANDAIEAAAAQLP